MDIATGEGQSLGIPLSFGGPYLGFIAVKKEYMRQLPGRIVGSTIDKDGKRGFVLTLQAREQHIRRERATSNICSNEALCALRALIYCVLLGKDGFKSLAALNYDKAQFAKSIIEEIPGVEVKKSAPTFNEFTICLPKNADLVVNEMINKGYSCGFPLGRFYKGLDNYLLVAVTEKRTKEEIVEFRAGFKRSIMQLIFEKKPCREKKGLCFLFPMSRKLPLPADKYCRSKEASLPEVSELDCVRHFTNLSRMNFSVDTNFYPLGSCTMKYNPKFTERIASLAGFTDLHPLIPQLSGGGTLAQGALEVLYNMERLLCEITGMSAFTLQPLAGAHGELTGVMLIAAYHRENKAKKTHIIIPDSSWH